MRASSSSKNLHHFFAVEILLHWRKLSPSETLASTAGLPLTSSLYLKPKQNHGFVLLYTECIKTSFLNLQKRKRFSRSTQEIACFLNSFGWKKSVVKYFYE
ncbi:hypothetical protein QL285_021838 [Trifolium repens]|nr:hypothetical protein QL285_021838 [Trifolium repens]